MSSIVWVAFKERWPAGTDYPVIAGGYRPKHGANSTEQEWTNSSPCNGPNGWDSDRTHWYSLPKPPPIPLPLSRDERDAMAAKHHVKELEKTGMMHEFQRETIAEGAFRDGMREVRRRIKEKWELDGVDFSTRFLKFLRDEIK